MSESPELDALLETLLAATPARVIDVHAQGNPAALAEVDRTAEALATLALALPPVAPPPGLRDRIAASLAASPKRAPRRALVVMDMLVDHLTPGRPLYVPRAVGIVPALRDRIAAARAEGEPVLYLCDRHEPGDPELDAWGAHNVAGTEGAEVWPELAPREGDVVVPHRTYSGFAGTELERELRARGVDTMVLTGCITEIHLFVTAADAMMRGFGVEVPYACQAGSSPVAEAVTLSALSVMRPLEPMPATP